MQPQPSRFKQRYEKLMQSTLAQQLSYPSRNPAISGLRKALRKSNKTQFTLAINESDLFKTCYYEDIQTVGLNIEQRVDLHELRRCIQPTIGTPGGNLQEYTQYCIHEEIPSIQQSLLDQNKQLEYFFKGISREDLASDLNKWLPFYCEVCSRYDSWDHPSHPNRLGKEVRRPIKLGAFQLSNQLQLLKLDTELPCEDEVNCALHQRSKLIKCAYEGQADSKLLEVNDAANRLEKSVQAELEKIKCVIDHSMSYCMLRVILWGTAKGNKPTCLELYFCIRKILGQPPLDLHVLERQPIEVELEVFEVGAPTNESDDVAIIEGPPKPPKYFLSKSNVCDGGGIFTFTPIKRGTVIGSYLGELLSGSEHSQGMQLRSRYQEMMNHSSYSFQSKNNVDIDSSFYGNFTRMLNHMPCTMANCRFIKNETDVVIVTVRDVQPGEELFVDYGTSYTEPWKERFDRIMKGLRNMKPGKEVIAGGDQSKEQNGEPIVKSKTCEQPREQLARSDKAHSQSSANQESIQRKHSAAVCRKSNVTLQKQIEVIELDLE